MPEIRSRFTVFFEDPFWVGVYERISDGHLEVCKITFGAEPKDNEVYDFLLNHWNELAFSPPVSADEKAEIKVNPKRLQREVKKQMESKGIGTKSQQALKLQQEENKITRKKTNREQLEEEKQRKFELRQQKNKAKHKGH